MNTATIHGFIVTQSENLTDEQRENNRKWVEALRSGKYEQTTGQLKEGCKFCCLGLAEDILPGGKWAGTSILRQGDEFGGYLSVPGSDAYGMPSIQGFKVERAVIDPANRTTRDLSELNDCEGFSFDQIADIIAFWAGLERAGSPQDKERP